MSVITKICNHI